MYTILTCITFTYINLIVYAKIVFFLHTLNERKLHSFPKEKFCDRLFLVCDFVV